MNADVNVNADANVNNTGRSIKMQISTYFMIYIQRLSLTIMSVMKQARYITSTVEYACYSRIIHCSVTYIINCSSTN